MDPPNDILMVAHKRALQVFLVTAFVWYLASVAFATSILGLLLRDLRFFRIDE